MKDFIKKNAIIASIVLVVALINLSAVFVIYNRRVMVQNTEMKERTDLTLNKAEAILNNLQAIDLGLRGYTITKSNVHFGHFQSATRTTQPTFDTLRILLEAQQYDLADFLQLNSKMNEYIDFCNQVVIAVNQDSIAQYKTMISQDKGFDAWKSYKNFYAKLLTYEKDLNQLAQADYNSAAARSVWIMVILILISVPTMGFVVFRLKRGEKARQSLFIELEQNNRRYNFDPGTPINFSNEHELIDSYINNSKRAADFVNQVALGQYGADWEGLNEHNSTLNQHNLAGALVKMRDQMKKVKLEEERRLWTTEGLSTFSEIIRNHQQDLATLSYQALVFLVRYLKAQQGSLFTLEDEEGQAHLALTACYAFDRKKFMEKRIEIGQGLIGQTYLEGQTVFLIDIPNGYTHITSGLGDSTPTCLLIIPMKYNDQVRAVIEIAGFVQYEPYQIEFMEKVGEFVASAVTTVQTNEKTQILLDQFRLQTEQMRAQEEEMRQNMEELEATQEEMRRKESEIGRVLLKAQEKEQNSRQSALQHQEEKEKLEAQIELLRKRNGKSNDIGETVVITERDFSFYTDFQTTNRNVAGFVDALDEEFREMALHLLKKYGITSFESNPWCSLAGYLQTLFGIGDYYGESTLFVIGKAILEKAELPPTVNSIEDLLASFQLVYHLDHAHHEKALFDLETQSFREEWVIGGHSFEKIGEQHCRLISQTPYPDELEKGVVTTLCRKFETSAEVTINTSRPTRKGGAKQTTYEITW